MCDLETSRIGAPYIYIYIYDISHLRVNYSVFYLFQTSKCFMVFLSCWNHDRRLYEYVINILYLDNSHSRLLQFQHIIYDIYRVSQEECARLREGFPYLKVYRYNPNHLCPKLNDYGDNGQIKVWSSGGSTHCTCQLTSLIDVNPWVWCPFTESQLTLPYSRLIPECAVSHITSVLAFMGHV